jgi:hypothetical protein
MKNNYLTEGINALQYVATSLQDNPIMQAIQLGLSILTSIILITYRIWKWHKDAMKDGKLSDEEIEEGMNIINDIHDTIKSKDDEPKH